MPDYLSIVAILATLVASFSGAWGAFLLENQRRKREAEDKNIGAANRAIYTLFNLWNILEQFRKEALEEYRGKPDAWLNVPATPATPTGEDRFKADELQFLLQSPYAQMYAALMLEEQRFAIAIQLIRERTSLVLDQIFPRMSAANIPVGAKLIPADLEIILGIELTHKLKQITASIYTNVDEDLESLRMQYEELRTAMKALYPKRKVLRITFEDSRP